MFSFQCRKCGHLEIMHYDRDSLLDYFESGHWPDHENQEEPPFPKTERFTKAEFEKVLSTIKRGYRTSLLQCPGFEYNPSEKGQIIQIFAQAEVWAHEYLPEEWQPILQKRLAQKES